MASPYDHGDGHTFWLKCTQDADIWESIPDDHGGHISHNDRNFLIVGKMPEYSRKRILIQFEDIPEEYANRKIKWAKMYLYYWKYHKASWQEYEQAPMIPRDLQVHQLLKSWNESETTSVNRSNDSKWNEPFVALDGSDAAAAPLSSVTVHPQRPRGYIEFDVTEAVSNWCTGQPNCGLLIWATNEDSNGVEIRFRGRIRRYDDEGIYEDELPSLIVQCSY